MILFYKMDLYRLGMQSLQLTCFLKYNYVISGNEVEL